MDVTEAPDKRAMPPTLAVNGSSDAPTERALLPLVRINGAVFVVENALHFLPDVSEQPLSASY